MLALKLTIHDILIFHRQNDISEVFDTTFCVEHNHYGLIQIRELKPGGRDAPVTEKNKEEYVKYGFHLSLHSTAQFCVIFNCN